MTAARRRHHVRWLFHSTAMVADYDLAVRNLGTLVGLTVLEYGESTEPGIGRRGGMAWVGDNAIEIGQPIVEGGAARFVSRFGGGMHSVALQVEDLEATMAHLEAQEVRIAARPLPEMCFTDPARHRGVFLQWSTFELAVDPRFGGSRARPGDTGAGAGDAPRLRRRAGRRPRRVGGAVRRAARHRRHLRARRRRARRARGGRVARRLHPRPLPARRGGGPVRCGGAPTSGRAPTCWRCGWTTWRRRPRRRPAPGWRRCGRDADLVVLDPAATGGVQVALTGSLLPGDPRL